MKSKTVRMILCVRLPRNNLISNDICMEIIAFKTKKWIINGRICTGGEDFYPQSLSYDTINMYNYSP